jgi:hypothetical protein
MSFNAEHAATGKHLEADFGILWQDTAFGDTQEGVLFAECKSYNEFERKDFERMEMIAGHFRERYWLSARCVSAWNQLKSSS